MVTASHNPEKDNGVKLVEPLGEMLPPEWEAHATRLANSADADLSALLVELSESLGVDLSAPGDIVVGRDTRSSSARLAMALCDGAGVLRPTRVRSAGVVTTPQLHYLVRCENDPTYGLPSIPGYEEKLICAFRKLLGSAERTPRVYTPVVNVDCACGVGAIALGAMLERLSQVGLTTNMVNLVGEGTLNEGCGADFVKTKQKPPAKADLSAGRWVSFDGDADRIVYFFSQDGFCLLDGDRIALLLASFLKSLLTRAGAEDIKLGLVQTAYANGASTARAKTDVGDAQIACAKTGVKHCHHAALAFDLGIYFEANGHGTVLFSDKMVERMKSISGTTGDAAKAASQMLLFRDLINETVGDAISIFLAVEAVLYLTDSDCSSWRAMYDDLPNRQIKVVVKDRGLFETTDAERICVQPAGLQAGIDKLVAEVPQGRCFVRPSGTEDVVRVYVEAATETEMLKLGQAVVDLVYDTAGGVGQKPVVS